MAINYDGQWELRLFYQVAISAIPLTHRMTQDVNLSEFPVVGETFDNISVALHSGGDSTLDVQTDNLVALLKTFFHSSVDITLAELWKYPLDGYDATFYGVYELGVVGTHATTPISAQQNTLTYRTTSGGIMRQQFMEGSLVGDGISTYPFPAGATKTLSDYMIGLTHGWVGRDNARPIVPYRMSSGANERLWRKRNRI